jgi:hypothetical protein
LPVLPRWAIIATMHLDTYDFGRLVIDGREVRSDVLLRPGVVRDRWWRREGHVLHVEDLDPILEEGPDRLVVGTGAYGRMRPDEELEARLAARGVALEVLPTAAAVERVNELLDLGDVHWAAALHLTC